MSTQIAIVERGRGPQLSTSRITVMDVFYYLHRGHDFDFIHEVMPSLTRPEFDAIASYVAQHQTELVEKDQRVELYQQRCKDELKARGLYREIDETIPQEVRMQRLKERLAKKLAEQSSAHSAS
jgi:uncharacterized protein (DUF433 family)